MRPKCTAACLAFFVVSGAVGLLAQTTVSDDAFVSSVAMERRHC